MNSFQALALVGLFFISWAQFALANENENENKEGYILLINDHDGVKKSNSCSNWDPRC